MNNASNLLIILPIIHASNMLNHDSNMLIMLVTIRLAMCFIMLATW